MSNTGAVIDGGCPNCERRIVGMMPQRCFYCGYDFTEMIKAQNASFEPDPNYKSLAADATPSEEEVYQDLKGRDRYGPDPFAAAAEVLNNEMDRQKEQGVILEKSVQEALERFTPDHSGDVHPVVQLARFIEREFPTATAEVEMYNDHMQEKTFYKARLEFRNERIIIEQTKVADAPFRYKDFS